MVSARIVLSNKMEIDNFRRESLEELIGTIVRELHHRGIVTKLLNEIERQRSMIKIGESLSLMIFQELVSYCL